MLNFIILAWQTFYYGFLGRRPNIDFSEIPDRINFISHYDKKHDLHWIESPELPEFYVTGRTSEELARNVSDTMLVYFDVPTYFARKMTPTAVFNFENKKTGQHETISVQYKEELDKVLA